MDGSAEHALAGASPSSPSPVINAAVMGTVTPTFPATLLDACKCSIDVVVRPLARQRQIVCIALVGMFKIILEQCVSIPRALVQVFIRMLATSSSSSAVMSVGVDLLPATHDKGSHSNAKMPTSIVPERPKNAEKNNVTGSKGKGTPTEGGDR